MKSKIRSGGGRKGSFCPIYKPCMPYFTLILSLGQLCPSANTGCGRSRRKVLQCKVDMVRSIFERWYLTGQKTKTKTKNKQTKKPVFSPISLKLPWSGSSQRYRHLDTHRPWWGNRRWKPLCRMHQAFGSGHFKPFCRLSLTSDLRWSTMLFITHLIVNERKCNQQLLSTLYMESRTLLSPEKMQPLMEPKKLLPAPCPPSSFWVWGRRREKSCKYDENIMSENPLLPQGHLQQRSGAEIFTEQHLTLPSVAFSGWSGSC